MKGTPLAAALQAHIEAIFAANAQKGFWEIDNCFREHGQIDGPVHGAYLLMKKAEKMALMHSEISEALEGIRKHAMSDKIPEFSAEEEELADLYIRLMDYAGGFQLRLVEAIEAKLAYNAQRPHKHGKAF